VEPTEALPASYVNGTGKISEWTLKVEALTWNGKTNSTPFQAVVDTGTWQNLYPAEVASQINAGFDPPGVWDAEWSSYAVPCNATPPSNVGIQIGGKSFSMNGADMIWQAPTGGCYSSVAPSVGSGDIVLSFLGDAFLKNVVAVFDVGHSEMRFAERQESNSTSAMPTGPSTPSTGSGSSLRVPVGLLVASGVALLALL
jgi:aspergillopepsin I